MTPPPPPPPPPTTDNAAHGMDPDHVASEVFGPEYNDEDSSTISTRGSLKDEGQPQGTEGRSRPSSTYSKIFIC